jgi:DNA-binding transcriptional MerR regulator
MFLPSKIMRTPEFFTADHVCQLTGLSKRQLRYWDGSGFFTPQYADENRRRPYSRVYSFRDLVGLRTIAMLRNEHKVPLQELRKLGAWLAEKHEDPWATLTFYVGGRRVFFEDPTTGARMAGRTPRQAVFPVEMEKVARKVASAARRFQERSREDVGKVRQDRFIAHNSPVIAGTLVPTAAVWSFHRAGYDEAAIIREYPQLKPEDVRAAIAYEESRHRKKAS